MKRYLVNELNIPEEDILLEPHSRHTTSNIRNIARITFRSGMPMEKAILVCSSESQIDNISSEGFRQRCLRELTYVPYKKGLRKGRSFVEMYPLPISLQINPEEPIDP